MSITKERLEEIAEDGFLKHGESKELARMALASLEAEPVAYVDPFAFNNFSVYRAGETDNKRMGREWMWANPDAGLIPVFTAPPAPVSVPDALPENDDGEGNDIDYMEPSEIYALGRTAGWNACRSAMLQSAENVESRCTIQTAPALDSSPKIAESRYCNSPVIPDGYALVPVEPKAEMYDAGDRQLATKQVWDAMIAAAPQQGDSF